MQKQSDQHSHLHTHQHSHSHSHSIDCTNAGAIRALYIGIILNLTFVVIELIAGFMSSSLGLLSDAGHNLSDVFSLLLSLIAIKLSVRAVSKKYTYGYKKSTVLVSFINAMLLLIAVGVIFSEAVESFFNPREVSGLTMIWVASVGVVINLSTALMLMKKQSKDLNIRGAFLHMAADTLVSLGVVVTGIVIYYTQWYIIDSIVSIVIAVVIAIASWNMFKSSLRLSLDGVPENVDVNDIGDNIKAVKGVKDFHHLHIWALSTTETAMTIHIVVDPEESSQTYKQSQSRIKKEIKEKMTECGINHVTVEIENLSDECVSKDCL